MALGVASRRLPSGCFRPILNSNLNARHFHPRIAARRWAWTLASSVLRASERSRAAIRDRALGHSQRRLRLHSAHSRPRSAALSQAVICEQAGASLRHKLPGRSDRSLRRTRTGRRPTSLPVAPQADCPPRPPPPSTRTRCRYSGCRLRRLRAAGRPE